MATWKMTDHLRRRYDPVVDQVTKMLMRDGKLSVAQMVIVFRGITQKQADIFV